MNAWQKGAVRAALSSAAGGVSTGLASIGVSPDHFNLHDPAMLVKVVGASMAISALIGAAGYVHSTLGAPS